VQRYDYFPKPPNISAEISTPPAAAPGTTNIVKTLKNITTMTNNIKPFITRAALTIGEEYYNDHFYIGLCRRGWVKGHSDYQEASLFHKTPKYFATLIKEATGIAATEWISRYVIIEARRLLKWEPNQTVQQISDQLGFSEQSVFCTYFKKHTGMTPMQFRNIK